MNMVREKCHREILRMPKSRKAEKLEEESIVVKIMVLFKNI